MKQNPLSSAQEPQYFYVGQLPIVASSVGRVVECCHRWIENHEKGYVCVTGIHGVSESMDNPAVKNAYKRARLIVPDGMPLVWIGKMLGYGATQRIYGPDLMRAVCAMAQSKKRNVFMYGTTNRILSQLKTVLRREYPNIHIVGSYAPPFRPLTPVEERDIRAQINATPADIILVGLSTPKQELWMSHFAPTLHANVLIGVGAAFDFIAGTKQQAPKWIRNTGGEWLYRLVHEPRRLWRRYSRSLLVFFRLLIPLIVRAIIPKLS